MKKYKSAHRHLVSQVLYERFTAPTVFLDLWCSCFSRCAVNSSVIGRQVMELICKSIKYCA